MLTSERHRFRLFWAGLVALQLPLVLFLLGWDLGLNWSIGSALMLLSTFGTIGWLWVGLSWVRRASPLVPPQPVKGWRARYVRFAPFVLPASFIVMGFIQLVLQRDPRATLWGSVLSFLFLWVPLSLLIGLPAAKLMLYVRARR